MSSKAIVTLYPRTLTVLVALGTYFHRPITEPFPSTIVYNKRDNIGAAAAIDDIQNLSPGIIVYQSEFLQVIDRNATIETLATFQFDMAHEAGAYCTKSNEVWFTSNRMGDRSSDNQFVQINKINLDTKQVTLIKPTNRDILMANGMTYDYRTNKIVICSQGHRDVGGSLIALDPATLEAQTLVDNYFGLKFNSLNDVTITRDGSYWFTDPSYGFQQKFRDAPQLGDFVYRYDPVKGNLRMVADGFVKPNGIAFCPTEQVAYVSDTGFCPGTGVTGEFDVKRPHTIYAYDVMNGTFLANRRVFAMSDVGIPDGIKVDTKGNVYTGTGDGIQVFNMNGTLIGKILLPKGAANLIFANNKLVMFSETKVYSVNMLVQGAYQQNNQQFSQTQNFIA